MNELPSTEHYEIVVIDDPEHSNVEIYGVRNKITGVVEYFDNLLPRVYEALQHTESKYIEMLNVIANGVVDTAQIVELDSEQVSH